MPNSVFMGVPGANPSGSQVGNPVNMTGGSSVPPLGGSTNPLTPPFPAGTSAPPLSFPAYGSGGVPSELSALENLSVAPSGLGADQGWSNAVKQGFHKAGFPSAIADLLTHFLSSGAGFNPQVAQAMIAALQPSIAQGQANIMEQFAGEGMSMSSPASIGLAGFDAQATLNEGQILSQMYEQSVQDYMTVLMGGRKPESQSGGTGSLLGGAGGLLSGISDIGSMGGGGGSAAAGAGGDIGGEIGLAASEA